MKERNRIEASQIFSFTCSPKIKDRPKKGSRLFRKDLIQMPVGLYLDAQVPAVTKTTSRRAVVTWQPAGLSVRTPMDTYVQQLIFPA